MVKVNGLFIAMKANIEDHRGGAHQPDVFTDKREEQQAAQRHHDGSPGARSEHGVQ